MNTSIRFPSRTKDVENEILPIIEKAFGCQALESDVKDATTAVVDAFHSADSMAGNGNGSSSWCFSGKFYATADIHTGEFHLYQEIL